MAANPAHDRVCRWNGYVWVNNLQDYNLTGLDRRLQYNGGAVARCCRRSLCAYSLCRIHSDDHCHVGVDAEKAV